MSFAHKALCASLRPKLAKSLRQTARFSRLLVRGEVAIDEAGDVVVVLFLFFKERVLGGVVLFDLDVVFRNRDDFFLHRVRLVERDQFSVGRSGRLVRFLLLDLGPLRARRRALEHRAAFWADDRLAIEIKELGAAILTLALTAEFGFRHLRKVPVPVRRAQGPAFRGPRLVAGPGPVNAVSQALAQGSAIVSTGAGASVRSGSIDRPCYLESG